MYLGGPMESVSLSTCIMYTTYMRSQYIVHLYGMCVHDYSKHRMYSLRC